MSNLNGNVQQNDFCGIVKVVDEIKEGIKNGFLYFYRDVQLVGMDQNFQRIYHIKLFNDQIYLNIQRDDFVVFKNSKIKNTVGNKIRLEFLRNESRLLIGDDQIKKIQGKQYLDEVDKNRKKYYKKNQQQNSLEKYFKKVKI